MSLFNPDAQPEGAEHIPFESFRRFSLLITTIHGKHISVVHLSPTPLGYSLQEAQSVKKHLDSTHRDNFGYLVNETERIIQIVPLSV